MWLNQVCARFSEPRRLFESALPQIRSDKYDVGIETTYLKQLANRVLNEYQLRNPNPPVFKNIRATKSINLPPEEEM